MNRSLATKVIIGLLAVIACVFVLFYFLVVRNREPADGGLLVTTGSPGSPVYPNSGEATGETPGRDSPIYSGRAGRDTEGEEGEGEDDPGQTGSYPGRVVNNVPITSPGSVFLISSFPVSGAAALSGGGASAATVRYIERERGNVYDFKIGSNRSERISIETILKVQEAFFADNGLTLIARYLDERTGAPRTYRARLVLTDDPATKGMYTLEGSHLSDGVSDVSVSPSGNSLFYLTSDQDGSRGYVASPASSPASAIFSSPAREWLSTWANDKSIALVTKAASGVVGYSHLLDTKAGTLSELLSPRPGLVVNPSPDTSYVLALQSGEGLLSRFVGRRGAPNSDLSARTVPEKCVWSAKRATRVIFCGIPTNNPSSTLPDDWFIGVTSYNDELWRFDLDAGTAEQLVSANQFTLGPVDVFRPFLTEDEKYLIFMNKKDLSLWGTRVAD